MATISINNNITVTESRTIQIGGQTLRVRQSLAVGTSGNSQTLSGTFAQDLAGGSLVAIFIGSSNSFATASSVTDNVGNTYGLAFTIGSGGGTIESYSFDGVIGGTTPTITVDYGAGNSYAFGFVAYEITGTAQLGPNKTNNNSGNSASPTAGAVSPGTSDAVIVAGVVNAINATYTAGANQTNLANVAFTGSTPSNMAAEVRIVGVGNTGPYNSTWTQSASGAWTSGVGAWRAQTTGTDKLIVALTDSATVSELVNVSLTSSVSINEVAHAVDTRTNFITNPNFEADTPGNGNAPNLWTDQTNTGTITYKGVATDFAQYGTNSAKISLSAAGDQAFIFNYAATPGATYTLSAWVKTDASVTNAGLIIYDSGPTSQTHVGASTNGRISVTRTVTGSGTITAVLALGQYTGGASAGTVWFDGILLEQDTVAGTYFDGATNNGVWTGAANGSTSQLALNSQTPVSFISVNDAAATAEIITLPSVALVNVNDSSTVSEGLAVRIIPATATLIDNWDNNSLSAKWTTAGSDAPSQVVNQNSRIEISHTASPQYNWLITTDTYDLTSSTFFVTFTNVGNQSPTNSHEAIFGFMTDISNCVWITVSGGQMAYYQKVGGVQTQVGGPITFNTFNKYFRWRESGGTVFLDVASSPGGWGNLSSFAAPFAINAIKPYIQSGNSATEAAGSFAYFDDFNFISLRSASLSDSTTLSESVTITKTSFISVSDTTTVTELLGNPSDTVGVSDDVAVTDTVSYYSDLVATSETINLSLVLNLSVSDTVTYTEDITPQPIKMRIQASDNITTSESVSTNGDIAITVSEVSTVTETITAALLSTVSVADNATATEAITTSIVDQLSVSDTVTVSEAISLLQTSSVLVSDSSAVSDTVTLLITELFLNVSDNTTVSEVALIYDGEGIFVSDGITTTESVTVAPQQATPDSLSVSDSATTSENLTLTLVDLISITDSATGSESVNLSVSVQLSVADTITTSETFASGGAGAISVSDSAAVTETIAVLETNYVLSVTDVITTAEALSLAGFAFISISDTASTSESLNAILVSIVSVSDTIAASEQTKLLTTSFVSVSDTSATTDTPSVSAQAFVNVSDGTVVSEQLIVSAVVLIRVIDASTTTDSIQIVNVYGINVSDSTTLTESIKVNETVQISAADSVATTETITAFEPVYTLPISDSISTSESTTVFIANPNIFIITVTDTVVATETTSVRVAFLLVNVSDAASLTDSAQATIIAAVSVSDAIASSENVTLLSSSTVLVAETAATSETIKLLASNFVSLSDNVATLEQYVQTVQNFVSVSDIATATETTSVRALNFVFVADASVATDLVSIYEAVTLAVTDTITSSDSPVLSGESAISVSDGVTVTESLNAALTSFVNVFDNAALSDTVNIAFVFEVRVTDTVIADELVIEAEVDALQVSDNIVASETISLYLPFLTVNVTDSATHTEAITYITSYGITVHDNVSVGEVFTVQELIVQYPLHVKVVLQAKSVKVHLQIGHQPAIRTRDGHQNIKLQTGNYSPKLQTNTIKVTLQGQKTNG